MKILIILLVVFANFSNAQTDNSLANELSNFKLNKDDIKTSLEKLKKEGKISNQDYLKALKELSTLDDSKIKDMQKKATDMVINHPEETNKMLENSPTSK